MEDGFSGTIEPVKPVSNFASVHSGTWWIDSRPTEAARKRKATGEPICSISREYHTRPLASCHEDLRSGVSRFDDRVTGTNGAACENRESSRHSMNIDLTGDSKTCLSASNDDPLSREPISYAMSTKAALHATKTRTILGSCKWTPDDIWLRSTSMGQPVGDYLDDFHQHVPPPAALARGVRFIRFG